MTTYLITNVRILDGTGREPFSGAVRVDGNRITEVRPVAAGSHLDQPTHGFTAPHGSRYNVIDGAGATLMPGLVESHAHIGLADMTSHELTRLPPEEHILVTVRNARTMLDCGYTSAFSAAAPKPRLDVVLKREIEAGRVPGPRLLANGPEITVTGGLGDTNQLHLPHYETPTFSWVADGPDAIRRVCRLLAREGVDLLKLNLSGDIGTSSFPSEQTPMTDGEVAAAMEVARAAELRVAAHCRSAESVLMALRHGIEVIYHANWADERALDALEAPREVRPRPGAGFALGPGNEHADRVQTVVVGFVQDEGRRIRVAQRRALLPVGGREAVAEARPPVALEDHVPDVVARSRRQRRPALEQGGPEPLHVQAGRAQRGEGALAALLERPLTALVAAPLHFGLAQAPLERRMAGQKKAGEELRLLHDDATAGTQHPGELPEGLAGLLDVMQHIATPDPIERGVREREGGSVALVELEARGGQRASREGPGRLDAIGRRLDADHAAVGADCLGEPERVEPHAASHIEAARASRQAEVRDEGARLRLLEAVHPLQRRRERLGLRGGRPGRLVAHGVAS